MLLPLLLLATLNKLFSLASSFGVQEVNRSRAATAIGIVFIMVYRMEEQPYTGGRSNTMVASANYPLIRYPVAIPLI